MKTLSKLFAHELRDVYSSEHLLVDALGTLAQQTTESNIANAFLTHRAETQEHIRRLETVAKETGLMLRRAGCAGMEGLIKEHQDFAQEHPEKVLFDLYSVWTVQKGERYDTSELLGEEEEEEEPARHS